MDGPDLILELDLIAKSPTPRVMIQPPSILIMMPYMFDQAMIQCIHSDFLHSIILILQTNKIIRADPMAKTSGRRKNIFNMSEPLAQHFFARYADCGPIFEQCGWLIFCQKLHGYDAKVTLGFAQGFDGRTAKIGNITFEI